MALPRVINDTIASSAEGVSYYASYIRRFNDEDLGYLAALGNSPKARVNLNQRIKKKLTRTFTTTADELIIGGGLHAATYAAATKTLTGNLTPVIEAFRLGGIFAASFKPAFYLNNRNRPGEIGLPGSPRALAAIPTAAFQPADINGVEYQTNVELAFAIRVALLMYSQPYIGTVKSIVPAASYRYEAVTEDDSYCLANRIILATGLDASVGTLATDNETTYTFTEFLRHIDRTDYPLEGWKNVAVIGAQDSGASVVKYLLGQGPSSPGPASLDTVEKITWFGIDCLNRETYEAQARSCYHSIGRYLPRAEDPEYYYRVEPVDAKATDVLLPSSRSARVVYGDNLLSGKFDHVVICTGYESQINGIVNQALDGEPNLPLREEIVYAEDGTAVATRFKGTEIYKVGPCANLPVTGREEREAPILEKLATNSAAIWRYADRTAVLARMLHSNPTEGTVG